MKINASAITAAMLLALAAQAANAAEAVGYNVVTVPANSDVLVSVPFNNNVEATFTVDAVAGAGITVNEALSADTYNSSYYIRVIDGAGEGLWSTITANGSGGLTIADDLSGYVANGDTFRVYEHQTLGSVFSKGLYGVAFTNGTQVYIYENKIDAMTQNKSAAKTAAYTTSGGGRWVGAGVNNNTVLAPETQFIVRNNTASVFSVITHGDAPDYSASMLIAASGDLVVASGYPVPVVLKDSGLAGNQRQVYFFDNAATGVNKSAVKTAAYTTSGGGRWVGAGVTGNELIGASEAVTLRLPSSEVASKITLVKPY